MGVTLFTPTAKARQTEFTVYRHRPHRFVDFHQKFQISKSPPIVLAIEGVVQGRCDHMAERWYLSKLPATIAA